MLNDFDFDLPKALIAQHPMNRGKSKLLHRSTNKKLINKRFSQIYHLLQSGDVLVLNNTRVVPSCLRGYIDGVELKINLINRVIGSKEEKWGFLSKPRKKVIVGAIVKFSDHLVGVVLEKFNQNDMDVIEFFKCSNIERLSSGDFIINDGKVQLQSDNNNYEKNLENNDVISQDFSAEASTQYRSDNDCYQHLKEDITSCIDQFELTKCNISNLQSVIDQNNHKVTDNSIKNKTKDCIKPLEIKNIVRQLISYSMSNTTPDGSYVLNFDSLELAIESAVDIQRDNNDQLHSISGGHIKLSPLSQIEFFNLLHEVGVMPLPPYMKRNATDDDKYNYQTVFSKVEGSVAAPTAGLHFTDELLAKLQSKGVRIAYVTLHIGGGTFLPVRDKDVSQHKMHSEFYSIDDATCDLVNNAKLNNNRVIAVGTTVTRTLESAAEFCSDKKLYPHSRYTDIFIREHYKFKIVDCLITNFHLPKSTLFMLVCSFLGSISAGQELYRHAISNGYRFFSYGDACFLER